MNLKTVAIIFAVLIIAVCILWIATAGHQSLNTLTYSQFLEKVQTGQIAGVVVKGSKAEAVQAVGQLKDGSAVRTILPTDYRDALAVMLERKVNIEIQDPSTGYVRLFLQFTPLFLCAGLWIFLMIRKFPQGGFRFPLIDR